MNKGFTLLELMIVVAIIVTLAAIVVPAYQDWKFRRGEVDGFGQPTPSGQSSPNTQSQMKCVNGFSFIKEAGQSWKPNTDRHGRAVVC